MDVGDYQPMTLDEIRGLPPLSAYLDTLRKKNPWDKPRGRRVRYGVTDKSTPHDRADVALALRVGRKLDDEFPGYDFRVEVEHSQGIVKINLPLFMGMTRWSVIHLVELDNDPGLKVVVDRAGELLVRYRLPRSGINKADWRAACAKVTIADQRRGVVPD